MCWSTESQTDCSLSVCAELGAVWVHGGLRFVHLRLPVKLGQAHVQKFSDDYAFTGCVSDELGEEY